VRQIASGAKRPAQVCREHHLSQSLLARWRRDHDERGEAAITLRVLDGQAPSQASAEQRIAELERLCGQLALENTALKKAAQKRALQQLQARQAASAPSAGR
jgi:transposase-like protein